MESNSDILFTRDILKKTAKDLGVTEKTVNYIYKFAIDYFYKQIESTDCCSFYLPNLGTLYINSQYVTDTLAETEHKLEKDPENVALRKKRTTFEHKKNLLRKYLVELNRPPSHSYHHTKDKINIKGFTQNLSVEELQDMQNDMYWLAKKENIEFNDFD